MLVSIPGPVRLTLSQVLWNACGVSNAKLIGPKRQAVYCSNTISWVRWGSDKFTAKRVYATGTSVFNRQVFVGGLFDRPRRLEKSIKVTAGSPKRKMLTVSGLPISLKPLEWQISSIKGALARPAGHKFHTYVDQGA
jgi:catabolite regulation protein CreA